MAHMIQGEEAGYELDAESADDRVDTAKIRFKAAREKAAGANREAAVVGVKEDKLGTELLEDRTMRNADESYSGESEHRQEHDTSRIAQVRKEFSEVQGHGETADKMAHIATLVEHEAHKELGDARQAREISESLLAGSQNDDREAKQAVKEAKEDAQDAAVYQDRSESQLVGFGDDPTAQYIVEGKHIYRARMSETQETARQPTQHKSVSPDLEADEAASAVQDALDAERAVEHRDLSWAMATGAAHGFGPKPSSTEPLLGEGAAPVFRISAESPLAAVSEVTHIASNMQEAAHAALAVAGNQADGEILQAVKLLATIGRATNATIEAGKAVSVSNRAEQAVHEAVIAPSGLGQANEETPAASATTQALIAGLEKKIKDQALQIKHLANQSAFAAEREASSWMSGILDKTKKENNAFDGDIQVARLDSAKREDAAEKDMKWSRTKVLVESSAQDLDQATKTADKSTRKYTQAASSTGEVLTQLKKLARAAAQERGKFAAMGPKMSDDRIAGSVVAKQIDQERTDQYQAMEQAEAQWRQTAAEMPRVIAAERDSSLDLLENMKMQISAVQDHSENKVKSTHAKCQAEKSTAVTCAEVKSRLTIAATERSCQDYSSWRSKIEKDTCIYDRDDIQSKFEIEADALAKCQKGVCQHGAFVNNTATPTQQKASLFLLDVGLASEIVAIDRRKH